MLLLAALLAAAAWQLAGMRDGPSLVPLEVRENLLTAFRDGTLVRETETIVPATRLGDLHTFEVERRRFSRARGVLSRPNGDPPFAWLVGRRVEFRLDVLRPERRELRVFVADATGEGQTCRLVFNGEEVGARWLPEDGRRVRMTAPVPAARQRHGENRLELVFERVAMQRRQGEPVDLPISGLLTRIVFAPPGGPPPPRAPVLRGGLEEVDGDRVLVVPPSTLVRAAFALPEAERLLLHFEVRHFDAALQVGLTPDDGPRVVLEDAEADEPVPRRVRVDLTDWAGETVLLDFWCRDDGGEAHVAPIHLLATPEDGDAGPPAPRRRPPPEVVPPSPRPSFLVVVLDALARRRVGALGYDRPTTPNLDALARRSLVFPDATAPASYTLASVGTLLTGTAPRRHGVLTVASAEGTSVLAEETPRLAALLRDAGWRTFALVTNPNAAAVHGYGVGFEPYVELFDPEYGLWDEGVPGSALPGRLAALLDDVGAAPFLAYVHVFEPHAPYDAPADLRERLVRPYDGPVRGTRAWIDAYKTSEVRVDEAGWRHLSDLYDARVALADRVLGALLGVVAAAGRGSDTVVIVASDHGEALGEHGAVEHGSLVYGEQIDVPLVVHVPGVRADRVPGPAALADVAPTLLGLAGLPVPEAMDGRSLADLPLDRERALAARSHGTFARPPVLGWTRRNMKLHANVGSRRVELYDLEADPDETRDLAFGRPATTALLHRELCRALCDARAERRERARPDGGDVAELVEQLEAIGYAGFDGGADDAIGPCPLRPALRRL